MTELKPCPFCGSSDLDLYGWSSGTTRGVACNDCSATAGSVSDTPERNILAWNTRTEASQRTEITDEVVKDAFSVIAKDKPILDDYDSVGRYEEAIEKYYESLEIVEQAYATSEGLRMGMADVVKSIGQERDALKARVGKLEQALREMIFAYKNKDGEFPHGFETNALMLAEQALKLKGE